MNPFTTERVPAKLLNYLAILAIGTVAWAVCIWGVLSVPANAPMTLWAENGFDLATVAAFRGLSSVPIIITIALLAMLFRFRRLAFSFAGIAMLTGVFVLVTKALTIHH